MIDTLDKVLETAKKLRKFAKKSADPAFVNLIADLNMELADLRVQLARGQTETGTGAAPTTTASTAAAPPASRAAATAAAPTTVVRGTSAFDATLNQVFGDDAQKKD